MNKVEVGKMIKKHTLVTAESRPINIVDDKNIVHLQWSLKDE